MQSFPAGIELTFKFTTENRTSDNRSNIQVRTLLTLVNVLTYVLTRLWLHSGNGRIHLIGFAATEARTDNA